MSETPPTAPAPAPLQRLRRIEIRNYKAIDALDLDFPPPLMAVDPDITVVGSANGVGKTSLLECCALAHLAANNRGELRTVLEYAYPAKNIFQPLIRAGQPYAAITGAFDGHATTSAVHLFATRYELLPAVIGDRDEGPGAYRHFTRELFGRAANYFRHENLLLFHSSRKIQEGSIPTSQLLAGDGDPDEGEPVSVVKRVLLTAMMGSAGLIENIPTDEATARYEKFNSLLETFTHCRLARLRNANGGEFELRVMSEHLNYTFDGLSSGQKEIVSTLFLIWDATRLRPGLVLIDEPELHLNAEWHRDFVRYLHKLAPQNQYILASHSEHIFASVDRERRILLSPEKPGR